MKEQFKRFSFLVLIVWMQFGSTGFVLYKNSCSSSKESSLSFKIKKCCCKHGVLINPKNSNEDSLKNKTCCQSVEVQFQTSEDFPDANHISITNNNSVLISKTEHLFPLVKREQKKLNWNLKPPLIKCDKRVLIQSFQI